MHGPKGMIVVAKIGGRHLWRKLTPTQALALSFGAVILIGMGLLATPMAAHGAHLSLIDAAFTATSALCVTGLVVVDTGTKLSLFGQGVVLALIQLGGLGIMTMSSLLLLAFGGKLSFRGAAILTETLGRRERTTIQQVVIRVLQATAVIELVGAALLVPVFLRTGSVVEAVYSAVFHSVSAFCNAGFSLYGTSFIAYRGSALLNAVIMGLIVAGGLGFLVLEDLRAVWKCLVEHRPVRLRLHTKLVLLATALLIVAGAFGVWVFERSNTLAGMSTGDKVLACLFQSVTARTAGFNTLDIGNLTNTTLFMTVILMFIGAGPGSCAGGVKVTTAAVVGALFIDRYFGRPHVSLLRRRLPDETVGRSVAIIFGSLGFLILVTFALTVEELGPVPHGQAGGIFLGLLFEVVSAFGTVGLSTGITPTLSTAGKVIIILVMFVGRLGPLSVAVAVARHRTPSRFQYATENVMVG